MRVPISAHAAQAHSLYREACEAGLWSPQGSNTLSGTIDLHGFPSATASVITHAHNAAELNGRQVAVVDLLVNFRKHYASRLMLGDSDEDILNTFPAGIKIITGSLPSFSDIPSSCLSAGRGRNSEAGIGIIKPIILKLLREDLIPSIHHAREAFGNSGAVVVCHASL